MERNLGRRATDHELESAFTPGVRFYFYFEDIINHPDYVFDGYHPAKVKNELLLSESLYACIIPMQFQSKLKALTPQEIGSRVHYLEQNSLGLRDWAEVVYEFVETLDSDNT